MQISEYWAQLFKDDIKDSKPILQDMICCSRLWHTGRKESDPSEGSEPNSVWVNTLSSECAKIMHACEYEFIDTWETHAFSQLWESLNFHINLPKHIFCYSE